VFVDEIDRTLDLGFKDDFFMAVRHLYNARAQSPELKRLSFVLIGVATPDELVSNPKHTPFNIGNRVELDDFSITEALQLAPGLDVTDDLKQKVLRWIYDWTNGHPYLTQYLCSEVHELTGEQDIDNLVQDLLISKAATNDHLRYAGKMLEERTPGLTTEILTTYREIYRRRGEPVHDEELSM
jgi:hypothetical protein